jgi:hypothetical protein
MNAPVLLNQDLLFLQDHPDREASRSGNQAVMRVAQVRQDQAPEGLVNQEDMAEPLTADPVVVLSVKMLSGKD